jgi:hypothetical protein
MEPMIEGICLHSQLRPVWEQVSPALGKNPRCSCFAKNSDIQNQPENTMNQKNLLSATHKKWVC